MAATVLRPLRPTRTAITRPAKSAAHTPPRAARGRAITAAILSGCVLLAGCGATKSAGPSEAEQLRSVSSGLDLPMQILRSAIDDARMSDRSSMVTLRAAADRAAGALRVAQQDLQLIAVADVAGRPSQARQMSSGAQDLQTLTDALSRRSISIADLELGAARARQASVDFGLSLSSVDTDRLISSLHHARRANAPAKTAGGVSVPVGANPATAPTGFAPAYRAYMGPAFEAQLPTGGGWASPAQSEPTPDQLFRTSVRGPGGLFVIIDYTPFEAATFGGHYSSRTQVGQTAFGSATKYVFQGGRLPECQRSTCVDYIINDPAGGGGFGVLAGGGSTASAEQIARTVAESVVPIGE